MEARPRVLIAGIGGASLGTELLKCLKLADRYDVFGCDVSEYAYGHYMEGFVKTFVIKRDNYVKEVMKLCMEHDIQVVIPGGEEPLKLLSEAATEFSGIGVHIAANSPDVVAICSDKQQLFERLRELGLPTPWTIAVANVDQFLEHKDDVPYPCIIKPSTSSGGSHLVFLASSQAEVEVYLKYILSNVNVALVQEYIPIDEGEFTIGVLSLSSGKCVGSIAMQRFFHTKLSILVKTRDGLISSGYSQGFIDEFPHICIQAEKVSMALRSRGPLNIQARIRNNTLLPFEINPRFSASTYLRAMAGFNEVDMYLRHLLFQEIPERPKIRPGYYLRSLTEVYVGKETIKA